MVWTEAEFARARLDNRTASEASALYSAMVSVVSGKKAPIEKALKGLQHGE